MSRKKNQTLYGQQLKNIEGKCDDLLSKMENIKKETGNIKKEIFATQTLQTPLKKIQKSINNAKCRLCNDKDETVTFNM